MCSQEEALAELLRPSRRSSERKEGRKAGAGGSDDDGDDASSDDDSFYNRATSKNSKNKDQPRTYETLKVCCMPIAIGTRTRMPSHQAPCVYIALFPAAFCGFQLFLPCHHAPR